MSSDTKSMSGKVVESFANLKRAVQGELETTLNEALQSAGYEVALDNLRIDKQEATTKYIHPESDAVIIESHKRKEHTVKRMKWGSESDVTIPTKDTITVYTPQNHVATKIKVTYVKPDRANDSVPVVSEIKDYFPPSKSEEKSAEASITKKDLKRSYVEKARQTTKDRNAARILKREHGTGPEPIQKKITDNETLEEKPKIKAPPVNLQGPMRRDRKFKIPEMTSWQRNSLQIEDMKINARMSKDRTNQLNGNYTVIQYSGNSCNVTSYNQDGKRLEQTTYNSYGEAVKSLGESTSGPSLKKGKFATPKPTDKGMAHRVKSRGLERERHKLSRINNLDDANEHSGPSR